MTVETALERALARIASKKSELPEDRFEHEQITFHERVRKSYLALSKEEPERFCVVDAAQDIEKITRDMISAIDSRVLQKR